LKRQGEICSKDFGFVSSCGQKRVGEVEAEEEESREKVVPGGSKKRKAPVVVVSDYKLRSGICKAASFK
ncbi:hypothetical protein HDU98_001338, partial [Podochytrium sp. JEL0797]